MDPSPPDAARRYTWGDSAILITPDGAVAAVYHPRRGHSMLLEENPESADAVFHEPARRWGKGFVITDRGGLRFDTPSEISWSDAGVELVHRLGLVEVRVTRRIEPSREGPGDVPPSPDWTETYEVVNTSGTDLTLGSVAVSTPWRDVYWSSRDSLRRAVHAHIWTGGAEAWVWAVPMDGSGPGLGLTLTEGALWAYSVESREPFTGSNIRGHLYLHVTDHARAPDALGGQPAIPLPAGGSYRWAWRLAWYTKLGDLHADRKVSLDAARLTTETGRSISVSVPEGWRLNEPQPVTSAYHGTRYLTATNGTGVARIGLLFHLPLQQLAERRARFVLAHQRAPERQGMEQAAFLPFDNESGLTVLAGRWGDWSEVRERVGTAIMLQQLNRRGWGDRIALNDALAAYQAFVVERVVTADGTVRDDIHRPGRARLYNYPWFARFLLDQGEVDLAASIMDRYYANGGEHFLAFGVGPVMTELAERRSAAGRAAEAGAMRDRLLSHARRFLDYGDDLPAHEVNYEQSMVAPLLELLLSARDLNPDAVPVLELRRRLRWLTAFAADQPDVRMRYVPIRHWDGYWFGRMRLWGDIFPHYWSVLTAGVYLTWPPDLATSAERADLQHAGQAILRANLANFNADGSATCAFVYPSCVNGQPAHRADPLANDQDWALVYALRFGLK